MARGPSSSSSSGKKTRGRQKIQMKKIEKEESKLVTFSKRRSGIYRKASELSILCGAEVAFVAFSPSGKPYSFGHPSVESIMNKYLNENPPINDNTHLLVEARRNERINKLAEELDDVETKLKAAQERGKLLELSAKAAKNRFQQVPDDEMNHEQLEQKKSALEGLLQQIHIKKCESSAADVADAPSMTPPPNVMNNQFGGVGRFISDDFVLPTPNYIRGRGFPPHGPF